MEDNENRVPETEEIKKPVEDINAMLEDDPEPVDSQELQDSILEDSDMNKFQLWLARMNDKQFALVQRAAGVVLALVAAACLFYESLLGIESNRTFSWGLIIAIVVALWVPNMAEKFGLRKMPKLRLTLAIALFVCIVVYFIVTGMQSGWNFTTPKA